MNKQDDASADTKHLNFRLGDERYGFDVGYANDIIEMQPITEVPQSSEALKGVINLRGTVIPVIDLRLRLGLPERNYDRRTVIIVVELDGKATGLIVDRVETVRDINSDNKQSTAEIGGVDNKLLDGVLQLDEGEVEFILDLEAVLCEQNEQLESAREAGQASGP